MVTAANSTVNITQQSLPRESTDLCDIPPPSPQLLRTWLGFSLRRNPFLCPMPLEKLAGVSGAIHNSGHQVFSKDKKGFYSVGGAIARTMTGDMLGDDSRAPSSQRVGGSAIADGDMVRIRGAASLIMQEEATHGR